MSNGIRLPGFLPPEKRDNVRFYMFEKLSYSKRMMLYLAFVASGFLFQILFLKAWPGAVFLVCATLLNLIRGYNNRISLKDFRVDDNWTSVDMKQIRQIKELERKTVNWDRDILDISNGTGIIGFILTAFALMCVYVFLRILLVNDAVGGIFITDVIILVLPLWFNGMKQVQKQDDLNIKAGIINSMEEFFKTIKRDGEFFKPALLLARDKNGKSIPKDSRFTVSFENRPDDFYGIQAQININLVESSRYPYFYCVIAAKRGFGLEQYVRSIPEHKKIIVTYEEDIDAEVIVIRQRTSKSSGYHTNTTDCKRIMEVALTAARNIIANYKGI